MESSEEVQAFYQSVRSRTLALTKDLSAEDMVVQSMPEASPSKWHLAHTTWFFEEFILAEYSEDYQRFDPAYCYLFNSYYQAVGDRHPRPDRGLLTRPSLSEIVAYREYVDASVRTLLAAAAAAAAAAADTELKKIVVTGLHHEMQHQELILTDLLHLLSSNPTAPAVYAANSTTLSSASAPLEMYAFEGGLTEVGATQAGFSYDCEKPRHRVFLEDYRLSNRLVSNAEWLDFMNDGGYRNPLLWLADGWDACQRYQWEAPLYWRHSEGEWCQFGLDGLQSLNFAAPVCHISYYEADAYARWAGKRLPSEQEWENAVAGQPIEGNLLESGNWRPRPCEQQSGIAQAYGDVWEWTRSPYMAYPGFRAESGALQEYNGKFMANQFVLRGGSCVTPQQQLRATYRNFFFPHHRWQFSGLRLAEDA